MDSWIPALAWELAGIRESELVCPPHEDGGEPLAHRADGDQRRAEVAARADGARSAHGLAHSPLTALASYAEDGRISLQDIHSSTTCLGGFVPRQDLRSLNRRSLAPSSATSFKLRHRRIRSRLERDVAAFGPRPPAGKLQGVVTGGS